MIIHIEIKGLYAYFQRPDSCTDKSTYSVPPPCAIRGILESIYNRPNLRWYINRIYVLTPIRFVRQDRLLVLRSVRYVADAHLRLIEHSAANERPELYQHIVEKRIENNEYFHTPYLGLQKYPASIQIWNGAEIPTIHDTRDFGLMLYDFDFSDPQKTAPRVFHAIMRCGIIETTNVDTFVIGKKND